MSPGDFARPIKLATISISTNTMNRISLSRLLLTRGAPGRELESRVRLLPIHLLLPTLPSTLLLSTFLLPFLLQRILQPTSLLSTPLRPIPHLQILPQRVLLQHRLPRRMFLLPIHLQ